MPTRYPWGALALFAALNATDAACTACLIGRSDLDAEINPILRPVLSLTGVGGLFAVKGIVVAFIAILTWRAGGAARQRLRAVLWGGNALLSAVVAYSFWLLYYS